MHIAFYFRDFYGNGTERVMCNIANALVENGHTVDIVLDTAEGDLITKLSDKVRVFNLKPRIIGYLKRKAGSTTPVTGLADSTLQSEAKVAPTFTRRLRDGIRNKGLLRGVLYEFYHPFARWVFGLSFLRYVYAQKPDIIVPAYAQWSRSALFAKAMALYTPKVLITQHISQLGYMRLLNHNLELVPEFFYQFLLKRVDGVICVSQGIANLLINAGELPPEKIHTIYNPIYDEKLFAKNPPLPNHPWYQQKTMPIVLNVGRLSNPKNHVQLLEAFALVLKKKQARLVILGEGELREYLLELAKKLGIQDYVSMPGRLDDPSSYYAHADMFALSSISEGLPTVLIEALAYGLPCVSTDCPTGPDEILDKGNYGMLMPMHDAPALAECILATLEGKQPTTREERVERAKVFSVATATKNYLALFNKVLAKGNKR